MGFDRLDNKIKNVSFKSDLCMFPVRLMILAVITGILLISCGPKLTPGETVQAYFEAIKNQDIRQISEYIVDGSKYYKEYQNLSEIAKSQSLERLKATIPERVEINKEIIYGDSAMVTVNYMASDYIKTGVYQLKLRKVGGKWKIDLGLGQ